MTLCPHDKFMAQVNVQRIVGTQPGQPPLTYMAEVQVWCPTCLERFHFVGLPLGASLTRPMVSPDGLEARLPIAPGPAGVVPRLQ